MANGVEELVVWPSQANIKLGVLMELTGWSRDYVAVLRESYPEMAWRRDAKSRFRYVTDVCRRIAEGRFVR